MALKLYFGNIVMVFIEDVLYVHIHIDVGVNIQIYAIKRLIILQ